MLKQDVNRRAVFPDFPSGGNLIDCAQPPDRPAPRRSRARGRARHLFVPLQSGARRRVRGACAKPATASPCATCAGGLRGGAPAPSVCSRAAPNSSRNILRSCANCASAASRSRRSTGADKACRIGRCAIRAKATSATSRTTIATSKSSCARSCCRIARRPTTRSDIRWRGATLLRMAEQHKNWFERTVLSAPMIGLAGAAAPHRQSPRALAAPLRVRPLVHPRWRRHRDQHAAVRGQQAHVRSGTLRAHRSVDRRRAATRARLADGWLAGEFVSADGAFEQPSFARRIQHPLLIVGAGHDEVVSTAAMEKFASHLLTGSRVVIPGARHEILMEQDRFRELFWAAFDAFVPST